MYSTYPENLESIDFEDTKGALRKIVNYLKYMCERSDFAINNTRKNMPNVPDWAMSENKPVYTVSEINGALSDEDLEGHNTSNSAHTDIRDKVTALQTFINKIKYYYTGTVTLTVPSSTAKSVASFVLPAGLYIITATARFATNTTGVRWLKLSTSKDEAGSTGNGTIVSSSADSSYQTHLENTQIWKVNSETTFYANAWHNAGASLSTNCTLSAIRIADYKATLAMGNPGASGEE